MKILLISGHGAGDPGAIGTFNGVTYKEADLTREVVSALAAMLNGFADVTVYDQSRNAYTDYCNGSLNIRANFQNYDLVLEVHFNAWKIDSGDGKNKGVEIFAKGNGDIERNIVNNIAALGFTNRGVKSNSFAVINTARSKGTRAALLEVCFIDDADDMRLFNAKKNDIVAAIAKGFGVGVNAPESGANNKGETVPPKIETPSTSETVALYRVQLGAFSVKKNATNKCDSIKAAGFDAFVVQVGALWKVQVGAFKDKANADDMVKKLQKAGFSGLVVKSSTTAAVETISVGSTVMVKKGAKTYDGATLATFVYNRVHDVKQISGERVVITYNGITVAAVRKSDLIVV